MEELRCRKCFGPTNRLAQGLPNLPCWDTAVAAASITATPPSTTHISNKLPPTCTHQRSLQAVQAAQVQSSAVVYIPQVTAMLSFVLSTRKEIPTMYGSDSASTHVSKILSINPRRIFHSVLSSIQSLVDTGGYPCFQVQFIELADNSIQI